MTSTITLYQNCSIAPSKLFIVDSIEDYLSTLTNFSRSDFQYIRHGLKISVKLNLSQEYLNNINAYNFNYCSITNIKHEEDEEDTPEKTCYYFIMKKNQIAKNTIELELEMDTINTFKPVTDFTIEDKTTIHRMHKDRFVNAAVSSVITHTVSGTGRTVAVSPIIYRYTYSDMNPMYIGRVVSEYVPIVTSNPNVGIVSASITDDFLSIVFQSSSAQDFSFNLELTLTGASRTLRKIDKLSEGVTPLLYGKELGMLIDNEYQEMNNWYLIYKGTTTIECLCCPDYPVEIKFAAKDTYTPSDFTTGVYYYFMCDRTSGASKVFNTFTTNNGDELQVKFEATATGSFRHCVVLLSDGTNISLGYIIYTKASGRWYLHMYASPYINATSITISGNSDFVAHTQSSMVTNLTTIYGSSTQAFTITPTTHTLKTISSINRSDTTLVKIIKLPYAPFDITDLGDNWTYNSGYMQYSKVDSALMTEIVADDSIVRNPLTDIVIDLGAISKTDAKSIVNESKLFHSDYYQPKFVYDSFTKVFDLERINLNFYELYDATPFMFTFVATNTVSSKFIFEFPQFTTENYKLNDYDNILAVDRNNEMTIYSSDYMNYIKSGFNYDIKKKNREEAGQWIGTAVSMVGAIASFASSVVTSGFGIAGGITLATTALAQLTRAVNTTAQAEATQNQKLMQYRMQKDSVYNTDAVDLLTYYSQNKAKLMLYKVSENVEKTLWDLFFYTGYVCGYRGIPNYTSRTWFNFLACELEIEESSLTNISEVIMNDIKAKYGMGVTFLHKNVISGEDTWDFTQQYENWETSLF